MEGDEWIVNQIDRSTKRNSTKSGLCTSTFVVIIFSFKGKQNICGYN